MKIGVLILGYKRPQLLRRTLSALETHGANYAETVFFSLDGPSHPREKSAVTACESVFEEASLRLGPAKKIYSIHNRGLRRSVMESVSSAFEAVDALVVLEDDCVVGPSSLDFFRWGLASMKSHIDVGVISGTYLGRTKIDSAFYSDRFSSWGWGTNRETWEKFLSHSFSTKPLVDMEPEIKRLTRHVPLPYKYEYGQIRKNLQKLDSWEIPFDMFLRDQNLRALKPTKNQIQNIGFGVRATHTSRGGSLSISAGYLKTTGLIVANQESSSVLEKREAWVKFLKLARERLFSRDSK